MPSFYLIHSDPAVSQMIAVAIKSKESFQLLGQAANSAEGLAGISSSHPDVVLFEFSPVGGNGGFEFIQKLTQKFPATYTVPMLEGNEGPEVWQKILRMNLRDVLFPPYNPQTLVAVITSAAINAQHFAESATKAGGGESFLVTVASARGGVGKSVFAVNLTLAMTQMQAPPLLIDYSMSAGDFVTMLDQVPRNSIADAINQGAGLDLTLLRNLVAEHPLGFYFLACPNDDFDFYGFQYDQARDLLRYARSTSEFVVVDTGVYDLPMTSAAVDEADLIFLIATRDLTRLMATHRLIKGFIVREIDPARVKIIINNSEVGTEITDAEIEDVLQHPVTAYLPSSPAELYYSINSGKPLGQMRGEHPMWAVISKLAEYAIRHWPV